MDVALAELCLLGNKTQMWPFILIASSESLNYKHAKVLVSLGCGGRENFLYLLRMPR